MNREKSVFVAIPRGSANVWWGWVASPAWWLAQFEARYALVPWACGHHYRWAVLYFGLFALAVSALLICKAWSINQAIPDRAGERFLTLGSLTLTSLFAILTATQLLPDLFMGPCRL